MKQGLANIHSAAARKRQRATGNINGGIKLAVSMALIGGVCYLGGNAVNSANSRKASERAQLMANTSPRVIYVQAQEKERGFWSSLGNAVLYGNGNNNNGNLSSSVVEANMAQLWNNKVFGNDKQNVSLGGRVYSDGGYNNNYSSGYHGWRNWRSRRTDAHAKFDQNPSND